MVTQRVNTDRGRSSERNEAVSSPSIRSTSKENKTAFILRPQGESRRVFFGLTLLSAALFCTTLSHIDEAGHRLDSLPKQGGNSNLRPPTTALDSQCRVYLAESSIPNGGLGVFTTEFIPKGGQVGDPGLCIQVHIPEDVGADQLFTHTHGTNAFFYGTERNGRQLCSGISTIVNTQMKRSNMAITALERPSHAGLTRFDSPGAGAISHHYGQFHSALNNIPAGTEITYDYGDWELPGEESKVTKQIMPHRPLSFIRQEGMCMDNINVKPSLLPHAGRGAFASRAISTGDLVAPAPLIMVQNKKAFHENELLRNYMFEVEGSDMAFVPYGEGVNFINHSRKPNVGLRWSTNKFHRGNLLTLSEHDLWERAWPGALILEVYALRFIRQGEELVLDYGDSWETAWKNHVQHWKQKPKSSYVYPSDLDETEVLRTVKEQETDPYPSNLAMACFNPFADDSSSDDKEDELEFRMTERDLKWEENYNCWCHVLDKAYDGKEEEVLYTVSLQCSGRYKYQEYDPSIPESQQEIMTKVPRHAIRWENKPYQGDQFLKDSFRHSMEFPENLFPEQWKRVTSASTM